jgi:hypothetical protein
MIQPLVQESWPPWPNQARDWTEIWSELLLPSDRYVSSFKSIAPVVTKGSLLTDNDGHHMIGMAPRRRAKNCPFLPSFRGVNSIFWQVCAEISNGQSWEKLVN